MQNFEIQKPLNLSAYGKNDCIEGVCPYVKAEKPSEIEEERRLFYVAMTRAKEYLYMFSYLNSDGKTVKQSPFVPVKKRPVSSPKIKK